MTEKTRPPLLLADSDDQTLVALAHLSMLAQAANGEYRPGRGEIEERQAWLISFIRTGQGIVNEDDRQFARGINEFLASQFGKLNTQPDAA